MAEKIDENITAVAGTEAVRGGNRDAEEAGAAIRCDKEITADEEKNETAAPEKKRGVFARLGEGIKNKFSALKSAVRERENELEGAKKKRIAAAIALAVMVVFYVLFYVFVGLAVVNLLKDPQGFKEWIDGFGTSSILIFIGLRVVMTAFRLIPGGPLQVAGGYAFGTWWGALWCMAGSLIGTLIIFLLGKKYGTKLVGLFISPEKMRSAAMLKDKKKRNVFCS